MSTERLTVAVDYAPEFDANQARKGTDIPFSSHLLGFPGLVFGAGFEVSDSTLLGGRWRGTVFAGNTGLRRDADGWGCDGGA
jgi:hypothetical protein